MRRFPFDRLHHSARRQSRRHIQQQMYMIGSHMPLHDLDIQRSANLSRQVPHLFPDLSSQSRLAVLGDEHKVISQPIHCMRTFPILRHLRSVPPSLLKASPKGEGVHPSQSGTLREILSNLLSNAVEASKPGGEIVIAVGADRDHLSLAVEDQGEGVPERLRRSIFLPFFSTKSRGTGLGLAIVQKRVEQLGGEIRLESSRGYTGARFVVRVPVQTPSESG